MIGGKQTSGPSPGERDQKELEGSLKVFSQDGHGVIFLVEEVVPTGFRTHVVATTVCATGSVLHAHFFWCTYTARTLRTFVCVLHTCMAELRQKGSLDECHNSPSRFLPLSCFTRLCCSHTVTSRPLPTTTSLTIPSTRSCRTYLSKKAQGVRHSAHASRSLAPWPSQMQTQVMSPTSSTSSLLWTVTRCSSFLRLLENHEREHKTIRCFQHGDFALHRESRKKACNRETVAGQREREKKKEREGFVISVAQSMSKKD